MNFRGIKGDITLKFALVFFTGAIVFSGCKSKNSVLIEGTLKSKPSDYIYVSKIDIDKPVLIDSVRINRNNRFKVRIKAAESDFYEVGFSNNNFVNLLADPGEEVTLSFPGSNLTENYTVSGSEGSALVKILDDRLLKTKAKLDSLLLLYNKETGGAASDSRKQELQDQITTVVKDQRKFNITFIINHINSLASIKALYQKFNDQTYVLYESRDIQYLKIVSDSLKVNHPESKHTKALLINFEKELNQFNARRIEQLTNSLPETKLDPDCKDLNGKRVILSSLKGKYVLLSFWSAESRECVAENLQLKEYYRNYNKKGFEIYQINLDADESVWRDAVKFDALPWINTREDNPEQPKYARLFNVRSVPANFLFDPEGQIVATNLHGRNLQIKFNQIF